MFFLNAMMLVYETVEYRHANEKFKNRRKKNTKSSKNVVINSKQKYGLVIILGWTYITTQMLTLSLIFGALNISCLIALFPILKQLLSPQDTY